LSILLREPLAQAGDRVDGLGAPVASVERATPAGHLQCEAGMWEADPDRRGGELTLCDSTRPWPLPRVTSTAGTFPPGQSREPGVQLGLVALHGERVMVAKRT
jgi:hypothetical protein